MGDSNYSLIERVFVITVRSTCRGPANVSCTPTRAGMAIAALEDGLRQVHMYSTGYWTESYHDYEEPSWIPTSESVC